MVVRVEAAAENVVRVPRQRLEALPRLRVPETQALVIGCRTQVAPTVAPSHVIDALCMALEPLDQFGFIVIGKRPYGGRLVGRCRG